MEEKVRSFIAIELPEAVQHALGTLQAALKRDAPSAVKWVDPGGIHLTLKFLGYVPAGQVGAIVRIMEDAVRGAHPFCLELGRPGAFPNLRRVSVAWVGLIGDIAELGRIQGQLEEGLVPLGFPKEDRPFAAHLTLARVREQATPAERLRLGEAISRARLEEAPDIEVRELSLMRSQLSRAGAIYTRLSSVSLV